MKALALTNKGIEDIASLEIKELIGAKAEIIEYGVVFDFNEFKELFLLCYKAQTITKIVFLLDWFSFKENPITEFEKRADGLSLKEWRSNSFCAETLRIGEHDFSSVDISKEISKIIQKRFKAKPDFKNPETTFFVYIIKNFFYFGIDFSGKDLSRRDYRIFLGAEELKPNIAYALLRIAGFKHDETLLDPFCRAGIIPIEAALLALNRPHNYYNKDSFLFLKLKKFKDFDFNSFFKLEDENVKKIKLKINCISPSFNHITAAKKNAKIAGVVKNINFSRFDIEWLDTKFKKASVDKIVSMPVQLAKHKDAKQIEKAYKELFHQAKFVLKKGGVVVLVSKQGSEMLKKCAEEHEFKLREERKAMQGKEEMKILIFELVL